MAQAVLDRLGWAYVGIAIAWTVALASGLLFLHTHRHLPGIRMRRLPVLFTGVISLHIYGIVCIIGYVIGPLAPCSAEFWIMRFAHHGIFNSSMLTQSQHLPTLRHCYVSRGQQPISSYRKSAKAICSRKLIKRPPAFERRAG